MKLLHHTLLVWLLLLALPFQGLASAAMLPCAAGVPAPGHVTAATPAMAMDGAVHDHAAIGATAAAQARDEHCASAPDVGHHDGACGASHDGHGGKAHGVKAKSCTASCAACCVGAAMAPAAPAILALTPSHFISIPFRAGHVPSVDLALPERPPRTAFA